MSANRKIRYNRGGSFYLVDVSESGAKRKTLVIAWKQRDGSYLTRGTYDGETWEPAVSIEPDAPTVDVATHYLSAGLARRVGERRVAGVHNYTNTPNLIKTNRYN